MYKKIEIRTKKNSNILMSLNYIFCFIFKLLFFAAIWLVILFVRLKTYTLQIRAY